MTEPIVFRDRERNKNYVAQHVEVIAQVMMKTSDQSTVVIDLENLGQITIKPWSSDEDGQGNEMFSTSEDRTTFNPANLHDVLILELMATHARKFKTVVDEETERLAHSAEVAG
jgi:hypothetical protein